MPETTITTPTVTDSVNRFTLNASDARAIADGSIPAIICCPATCMADDDA